MMNELPWYVVAALALVLGLIASLGSVLLARWYDRRYGCVHVRRERRAARGRHAARESVDEYLDSLF